MRPLWTLTGGLCVMLGIIGIFLPGLPTVVFMIMAAFCFSKGSDRAHDWLMGHAVFGPMITNWHERGAISLRAKYAATISIAVIYLVSIMLSIPTWGLILQGVVLCCVLIFIWTRPNE